MKKHILVYLLVCFFSLYNLGRSAINNDAQLWYTRTQNFIKEVKRFNWAETYQNPKPGVTVMWISGISLDTFLSLYEKIFHFRPLIYTYDTFKYVHSAVLLPLVITSLVFIYFLGFFIKKTLGSQVSLFTLILVGFQPFYIGISRIFHADSVVTSFMGLCVIFSLLFIKRFYLSALVSGVFAGLAILSKSSAAYLIPFIVLTLLVDWLFEKRKVLHYVKYFSIWLFTCSLTFFVLFPSMWVKPIRTLEKVFVGSAQEVLINPQDGGNTNYFESFIRVNTPFFLVSLCVGLFFLAGNYKNLDKSQRKVYLLIFLYCLFFMLQLVIVKQQMERYILPIIPFLAIIGAYGLNSVSNLFSKNLYKNLFILFVFTSNLLFILYYFPYYLIYPSERGKDQFGCSLCPEIGDYLNKKPNPSDLKIISLSNKVYRLQPYIKGKIYKVEETLPNNWTPEYLVSSNTEQVPDKYTYCLKEKEISFRKITYWNIYKCKM